MKYGPQNEPIAETDDECRMTTAELRGAKHKHETPDSAVAAGTDRAQELEFAAKTPQVGPQGELLISHDAICPVCGQQFPETCSQPGEDLSPDAPVIEDSVTELSA